MNPATLARTAPFILFMAFIGLEELVRLLEHAGLFTLDPRTLPALYPLRVLAAGLLLYHFRAAYREIDFGQLRQTGHLLLSLVCGLAVFLLWIRMDTVLVSSPAPTGFNPLVFEDRAVQLAMSAVRLSGAVLVVPLMEELFWRSFLLRYLIDVSFLEVPVGQLKGFSFLACSLLFGLEHTYIAAGVMAGVAYTLLLYRTRSLACCILAHALTNLLLGCYVLKTGAWRFW